MPQQEPKTSSTKAEPEAPPKNRFERHPWLTLIVIVLGLLVVTIGAVEWSLALFQDRINLSSINERGEARVLRLREWTPGTVKLFASPENRFNDPIGPVDREYELRIDQDGFIWPSVVHDKPDLEIAFLGGSTTESLYVRPDMRFPHRAGRLLEERTGLKINALNGGKSGNTSMHALLNYLGKVAPRRPRFVVLMEGVNDIGLLNREKTYWNDYKGSSLLMSEDALEGRSPIEDFVQDVREGTIPNTYRLVRRGYHRLKQSLAQADASPPARKQTSPARPQKKAATAPSKTEVQRRELLRQSYEPSLRSFVRLAKAWGSEPVLMTQVRVDAHGVDGGASDFLSPEELRKGNFDPASFGSIHDYANAIVRHVALTEGSVLIDLAAARKWTREDVYDGLHFTETGSRHVAELIEQALAPLITQSEAGSRQDERLPDDDVSARP